MKTIKDTVEEFNFHPFISKYELTLTEEPDSCKFKTEEDNTLKLKVGDTGGGKYLILKTKRWAIDVDEIDKFCELLKSFMRQVEDVKSD